MFQTEKEYHTDTLQSRVRQAERNYIIQKNDYISLQVFSNSGERIIDPDNELGQKEGEKSEGGSVPRYLVRIDGKVDLPMIGSTRLEGYTLTQADSVLNLAYSKYYKNAFVITKLLNKRVVVLGPVNTNSGVTISGKVIPLENDNMNLIEVLALFGGISDRGKSYNIRVIRGDLKHPEVNIIDLSTIQGMRKANLAVYPNDIIYIEPTRRAFLETVRDVAPLVSLLTNLVLAIVIISR